MSKPFYKSWSFERNVLMTELVRMSEVDLATICAEISFSIGEINHKYEDCLASSQIMNKGLRDARANMIIFQNRAVDELQLRRNPPVTAEQRIKMRELELQLKLAERKLDESKAKGKAAGGNIAAA